MNGLENGKTQLFHSGGVVKKAYFLKKWSIPLREQRGGSTLQLNFVIACIVASSTCCDVDLWYICNKAVSINEQFMQKHLMNYE